MKTVNWLVLLVTVAVAFTASLMTRSRPQTSKAGGVEIPVYPRGSVLKEFEAVVNLRSMKLTVIHTTDPPAKALQFYREKLVKLGWKSKSGTGGADLSSEAPDILLSTSRTELSVVRGALSCSVTAFQDVPASGSYVFVRVEETGQPRYKLLPSRAAAQRCRLPIFPGVSEVLLVEEGPSQGTATILYDTVAPVEAVANYYRKKLGAAKRVNPASPRSDGWTCDAYRLYGRRVGLNLLRVRGENRTSVLLVVANDTAAQRPERGAFSRWLTGATY